MVTAVRLSRSLAALVIAIAGSSGCGSGGSAPTPQQVTSPTPSPITTPVNAAPVANAGPDANAFKRESVTLDGSLSADPESSALTYTWTQTAGPTVVLSSTTAAKPTFAAPSTSTVLTFSLTVKDATLTSIADTVTVSVVNRPPTASAGGNKTVRTASLVTLDGRSSSDPDGDPLTYTWKQLNGVAVTLNTATPGTATFTAPSFSQTLNFSLVVNDGEAASGTSESQVSVTPTGTNSAPLVSAGSNQTQPRKAVVFLNGSASDVDGQAVTTTWKQLSGPAVTLANVSSPFTNFTAPNAAAVLVFEISGTDGTLQAVPRTVTITIQNFAPTVTASLSPTGPKVKNPIVATVSATDADGDPLTTTYSWTKNTVAIAGQSTTTLPIGNFARGDVIAFTATVNDGFTTTARTAAVTIQDTLPVFTATPPTAVNFGGLVSFHITGTDDDGDTIQYAIHHGPAGMQVNTSGDVSWTAKLPMFDTSIDVDWGVGITGSPNAILSGTIKVTDSARQYPLRRTGVELSQLHHGVVATDLDGDGHDELLIGSHRALYEYGRVGTGYAQRWVYPYSLGSGDITAVAAADVAGDSKKEIFVATPQHLYQLDGTNRRIAIEYTLAANSYCRDLVVTDLTNDGTKEVVCLSYSNLNGKSRAIVFNAQTGATTFQTPEFDSLYDLEVGNVDADAAKEIVLANGYVYDGGTFANEWAATNPFGSWLSLGDVDGDGISEVVAYSNLTQITAWDVVHKSIRWQPTLVNNYYSLNSVCAMDLDGDGTAEIVVSGASGWRSFGAYRRNGSTGATEVVFDDSALLSDTALGFALADLDQSGAKELIVNAGSYNSSSPALVGVNIQTTPVAAYWNVDLTKEPASLITGGQSARVAVGQSRLVFASGGSSYNNGPAIFTLDAATGAVARSTMISTNYIYRMPIDVVDYDNDGIDEALVTTPTNGAFVAFDILTGNNEWTSPAGNGYQTAIAISHGDFNGDNRAELVGLPGDGYIVVHDITNQTLLWKSDQIYAQSIAVIDVDGDGSKEIVALSQTKLYIFEQTTSPVGFRERQSVAVNSNFAYAQDLLVADTDGDGKSEAFVMQLGYSASTIYRYNNVLVLSATLNIPAYAQALFLEDLGTGKKNIGIVVSEDAYYNTTISSLMALDPNNGTKVWKSPVLNGGIGSKGVFYVDTNADGEREISFSSSTGMHVTR